MEKITNTNANTNTGQGLGIAGLIIGVVALFLALLPCTAVFAIILGIVGATLSIIALNKASKAFAPKGMMIGGTIVSILALFIATIWGLVAFKVVKDPKFKRAIEILDKKKWQDLDSIDFQDLDSIHFNDTINRVDDMDKLEKDMEKLKNEKERMLEEKKRIKEEVKKNNPPDPPDPPKK